MVTEKETEAPRVIEELQHKSESSSEVYPGDFLEIDLSTHMDNGAGGAALVRLRADRTLSETPWTAETP